MDPGARHPTATRWALLAVLAWSGVAGAADVWKWTDARGETHYGSAPPPDPSASATRVDVSDFVSDDDRRAAEARLARARADAARAVAPAASRVTHASASRAASSPLSCAQQRKRFDDSSACFAPYRYGRGKIRPQAYQHCVAVPEPDASCQ